MQHCLVASMESTGDFFCEYYEEFEWIYRTRPSKIQIQIFWHHFCRPREYIIVYREGPISSRFLKRFIHGNGWFIHGL